MKKILLSASVVAALFAAPNTNANLEKQITKLQQELQQLKKQVNAQNLRYYKKVSPVVVNSHLFFSMDLRSTFDYINEKTTSGQMGMEYLGMDPYHNYFYYKGVAGPIPSQKYVNQIFTNRVILAGVAKPEENLKAVIKVEVNNIFGANGATNPFMNPFQNVAWVQDRTPDDTTFRLRSAWFNWFFDNGFMFSIGRRPSSEGFPANLREGEDTPNHPLAGLINMEFDGISFDIGNSVFSRISNVFTNLGTSFLVCAGRGYSNTTGKWPANWQPAYSKTDSSTGLKNMDFAGFILTLYNDGQYSLKSENVWAWNIQGYEMVNPLTNPTAYANAPAGTQMIYTLGNMGHYFGEDVIFEAQGIGNDNFSSQWLNNFLDDTTAFVSYAYSKVHAYHKPVSYDPMTGTTLYAQSHSGWSVWVGADMDGFRANDRWGFNYVHGSKYWRSFTYGEDTLVGSIAAVRGNAYEVYYNAQIIPHLTAGVRATYIKYNYPGSDGFFGLQENPDYMAGMPYVDKATDIRAYIRYKF